jgi:hypothetical protein
VHGLQFAGKNGAVSAIREWKQLHKPDDREFEVEFYGPKSNKRGTPDGCQPSFERLDITSGNLQSLEIFAIAYEKYVKD